MSENSASSPSLIDPHQELVDLEEPGIDSDDSDFLVPWGKIDDQQGEDQFLNRLTELYGNVEEMQGYLALVDLVYGRM